jgi:transposase
VDRGRPGSKHHLIVDANGTPLAARLTGGNEPDVTQLLPLVDAVPPVRGRPGAPLRKPKCVLGDRAYASEDRRMQLACRNIGTRIPKQRDPHGSGLGVLRYVVEQALALLHQFRRLRVRYERRDDTHEAFMTLGCAMICWRRLHSSNGYL